MSSVKFDSSHPQYNQAVNAMRNNARSQTMGRVIASVGMVTLISLVAMGGMASLKAHLFMTAVGGALALEGGGLMLYSTVRRDSLKKDFGITSEEQNMKFGINDLVEESVQNVKDHLKMVMNLKNKFTRSKSEENS